MWKAVNLTKSEDAVAAEEDPASPLTTYPTGSAQDESELIYDLLPRNFSTNGKNFNNGNNNKFPFCAACFIQDNDPRVVYNGRWLLNGTTFQTTHSTTDRGARVELRFRGSKIVVFGTVPVSNATDRPPRAKYSIDGRQTTESTVPMANTPIQGQPFFQANSLNTEEHKLTIEVIRAETPYILQHFFVTPHPRNTTADKVMENGGPRDDRISVGSPGATARPTITNAADIGSPALPSSAYDETGPTRAQSESPSASLVRILSGVLGALIALIIVGILLFLLRRRQKKRNSSSRFFSKFWKYSPRPGTLCV
ncbi:hypothetical protein CC1G_07700 [Coprinopsis cinerea okayama7|uniref:Uncharacterized protein n=1 Tax=Coprinopsis cinerea (strain Okayama-7 / 130 / ATCC MYA-4618 / FGSC 9003) TaxID=240176 RepID=A8NBV3_COPC7|nr:hypothetical protein CC1G_07700 [Coprinopsis cinerea okayama7\|eukprot:XP_001832313.1 hypothetical protein CC1G_07700 [Coprinopsis cinerea okayama7\